MVQLPSRPGVYPDRLSWISHSFNTWDPQTKVHTAAPLSRTNLDTLAVAGYTVVPPADETVAAGNLSLRFDGGRASASSIPHRTVKVPTGNKIKPKRKRGRRKSKGRRRPDAEEFVVPEPVLYIGRGR